MQQCSDPRRLKLDSAQILGPESLASRQEVIAQADTLAEGSLEHTTGQDDGAFMVRASFGAHEGPLATDRYLKVGLVLRGEGAVRSKTQHGTSKAIFGSGSIFSTLPGTQGELSSAPMAMLGLCIDLERLDVARFSMPKVDDIEAATRTFFSDETIQSVMLALWHTSNGSFCSSPFFKEGVDIILRQLRVFGNRELTSVGLRKNAETRISRVKSYIEENFDRQIRISDMAREAGVEESQFFSFCRQMTGMTPFTYLTYRRLVYAKKLLGQGASITETAMAVNYANPSKFSAAFKRHFGQTPTQWRRLWT